MEYLNYLGESQNKINSISKEMKSNFFSNITDTAMNKHDELKFLTLMREELFRYKLKIYFFKKWKNRVLYNRDLIDEENPFINNKEFNYSEFKKLSSKNIINDSNKKDNYYNNNINNINRNNDNDYNIKKDVDNFGSMNFNEDEKKENNEINNIKDNINIFNLPNISSDLSTNANQKINNIDMLNNNNIFKINSTVSRDISNNNNNINNINDLLDKKMKTSINSKDSQKKDNKNDNMNNINYNDLLYRTSSHKKGINLQDSLKILNVQKNINDALSNTNELFNKIKLQNSGSINSNYHIQKLDNGNNNEYINENENKANNYYLKDNTKNLQNSKNKDDQSNNIDKIMSYYKMNNTGYNYDNINNTKNVSEKNSKNNNLNDLIYSNSNNKENIFNNFKDKIKNKNLENEFNNLNNIYNMNQSENKINNIGNKDIINNERYSTIENKNDEDKKPNKENNIFKLKTNKNDLDKYENNLINNNKYYNKNEMINITNPNSSNKDKNLINSNFINSKNKGLFSINTNENTQNSNNYISNSNDILFENKDDIDKFLIYKKNKDREKNIYIDKNNFDENKGNNFRLINNRNNIGKYKTNIFKNEIKAHNNNIVNLIDNNKKQIIKNSSKNNIKQNKLKNISRTSKLKSKNNSINLKDINPDNKSLKHIANRNNRNKTNKLNIKDNVISQKKFDLKNLFKLPVKNNNKDEEEKEKYKNSKYLTLKYRNYLNTEENLNISKSKSKKKNKKNKKSNYNIYNNNNFGENEKDIQMSLKMDHSIIDKIQNNFPNINNNINLNKNYINNINKLKNNNNNTNTNNLIRNNININNYKNNKEPNERNNELNYADLSVDRIRTVKADKSIDSSKNDIGEKLIRNGFFAGKSKKKDNYENESEYSYNIEGDYKYDSYNMKVNQLLNKYNQVKELFKKKNINLNQNYDYIKKCKGDIADIYGINNSVNNLNIKTDYSDEDYDDIFHPKNKLKAKTKSKPRLRPKPTIATRYPKKNDILSKIAKSEYSMSITNILDNSQNKTSKDLINYSKYYDYDDLINNITDKQKIKYKKVDKRTINKSISTRGKSDFSYISNIDEKQNKSYVLAPMAGVPVTNISFRARLKYFSNKKEKDLQRMMKKKMEEEKQIYTFQPKTGGNKLNVIKYNSFKNNYFNNINQDYDNNKKKKVDIQRINNLYLDYKDKQNKREELERDYFKKAGISFAPYIKDKNKEIIKFKKKIAQMPYLDRIEVYNQNREINKIKKEYQYYPTEK